MALHFGIGHVAARLLPSQHCQGSVPFLHRAAAFQTSHPSATSAANFITGDRNFINRFLILA